MSSLNAMITSRSYLSVVLLLVHTIGVCVAQRACTSDEFRCDDGLCIPSGWRCDAEDDCLDGSDELGCAYGTCGSDQFTCITSGRCIPPEWVCDGENDCGVGDGSDENQDCPPMTCSSVQFQCSNGNCIPLAYRCDHESDCGDTSDETGCSYPACSDTDIQCNDGSCVASDRRCDGVIDCRDGTDEVNCTTGESRCMLSEFACSDGVCLPKAMRCNHQTDCVDGSDESDCEYSSCSGYQFTCDNQKCISLEWVCDGQDDCFDGSDEKGCGQQTMTCPPRQWACPSSGTCIEITKLCNRVRDCENGEDESVGNKVCSMDRCGVLGCEFQCQASPSGGVCFCDPGYTLNADNRTCTDYDECAVWGTCEQLCENLPGTHKCSCSDGFLLENHKHCKATGEPVKLLYSTVSSILSSNKDGTNIQTIVTSENIVGLDYHYEKQKIFWTDNSHDKVYSANMDGSNVQVVVDLGLQIPENVAVDWIGDKLYIVESQADRLDVCNLNGSLRAPLITEGLDQPRGIGLDPTEGYLFLSDWGSTPAIMRAYMDGSNIVQLVTDKILWPNALTVDIASKRVFWADGRLDYVDSVTYNGQYRETVVSGGTKVPHAFSLTVFENYVYFSDWTKMGLVKVNKFLKDDYSIIIQNKMMGVVAYHQAAQPRVENPCGSDNGGCEHICVISHKTDNKGLGYRCLCQIGYELNSDESTCSKTTTFLLFTQSHVIRGIPMEASTTGDAITPITRARSSFSGVDYHAENEQIYFSDSNHRVISRIKMDGSGFEHFVVRNLISVDSLSVDWLGKNLYYVDSGVATLTTVKLSDSSVSRTLHKNLRQPRAVVVNPLSGYLFVSEWQIPASIFRTFGDGSNKTVIVSTELGYPYGLCIDYEENRLYWTDSLLDRIESSLFDGSDRQNLNIRNLRQPYGMAFFGDFLYFVDIMLANIRRVKKDGSMESVIRENINNPMEIRVYDVDSQTGTNDCSRNGRNGECSHFCFAVPGGRHCGCPYGMKIDTRNQRNCIDNPDEVPVSGCQDFQFECQNGRCIYASWQCDGENDCLDNSDEDNCGTEHSCSPYAFTCANNKCVQMSWRCDGDDDCGDNSDEQDCGESSCDASEFQCDSGKCIPERWKCDTDNDCGDGSDERDCENHTCSPLYFSCETVLRCIPVYWVCDGQNNCPDNSDENGCPPVVCGNDTFACTEPKECIRLDWRCDGAYDCTDRTDEDDCGTRSPDQCFNDEFQCRTSGTCIPASWECDGHISCDDGSDEHDGCVPVTCQPTYFQCDNKRCIPNYWTCDGDNDCSDFSDEMNCPTPPFQCPRGQWNCPETTICIQDVMVCNGQSDCPQGRDESPLCNNDRCEVNNGGCSHDCMQTPFGVECICQEGMELLKDNPKMCTDIDECTPPGACSQICTNQKHSFICQCVDGYQLLPDRRTCSVIDKSQAYLVIANNHNLINYEIQTGTTRVVISGYANILGTDFDVTEQRIYWSDVDTGKIYKSFVNGTDIQEVLSTGLQVTENLAVDWIGRNLYWIDYTLEIIEVAKLDGSQRAIIISENVTRARGLALDPREDQRLMFWSDWGRYPRIERAGMDGSDRRIIVSDKIYWPNGLALDLPTKRIYFGDSLLDFIDFCDYDGGNRQQVLVSTMFIQHLHALTVFEDNIYWTDRIAKEVRTVNKFTGQDRRTVVSGLGVPLDMHVYHPVQQPPAPNPCENSQCAHLCVLSPNSPGYACMCSQGYNLNADGVTCQQVSEPFLLYVQNYQISGVSLDPDQQDTNVMVPITKLEDGYDLDFDSEQNYIYWVQNEQGSADTGEIYRARLNGSDRGQFVPSAYTGAPVGIAIDWVSRNIYWSNTNKQTIEVMQLDGDAHYRSVIASRKVTDDSVGIPGSLCLDPGNGKIYWTSSTPAEIKKASMDGSNVQTIVNTDLGKVEFIAIDIQEQNLYWSDSVKKVVERSSVDGSSRQVVQMGLSAPSGLAVFGDYLYFADRGRETITRTSKRTQVIDNLKTNIRNVGALKVYRREQTLTNACKDNNGGCEHLCLPTGSTSKVCKCSIGFELAEDGLSCTNHSSFAVVSQLSVIRGFTLDDNVDEAMVPVGGTDLVILHVDVYMKGQYIYFCNVGGPRETHDLRRVKPDGSGLENVISNGVGTYGIRGIAIDWIAKNLYFTNAYRYETYLEVSRLDGSDRLVLFKTEEDMPRAIAVNPMKKYLYWCDYGQNPKIERSELDGKNRQVLISSSITMPRDICVDYITNNVYWADTDIDAIQMMAWDGSNRQHVRSDLPNPYGLAILGQTLYWVDRTLKTMFRVNKVPGSRDHPFSMKVDLESLRDVAIYDDSIQPIDARSRCYTGNGGCQQLCFGKPDGTRTCACANGQLLSDGVSCGDFEDFLLFARWYRIMSLHFNASNHARPIAPITGLNGATVLDFDHSQKRVYFNDIETVSVAYVSLDSPNEVYHLPSDDSIQRISGLAFDWVHQKLYLIVNGNTIRSMTTDGSEPIVIVTSTYTINALVVDPCNEQLFWSKDVGAAIQKSTMSGNYIETVIGSDVGSVISLAMDYDENMLYWGDSVLHRIERAKPDGSDREVIVQMAIEAVGLTVYGNFLYWTEASTASVYKAEKHTGADETSLVEHMIYIGYDLVAYSADRQKCNVSACSVYNGGCSSGAVCFPTGNGQAECRCPEDTGLILGNNNRMCVPADSNCGANSFTCANQGCISMRWICDVDDDCHDNSDEDPNLCYDHTCGPTDFACDNGRCIYLSWRCDFDNDCRDNSDERDCPFPTCNPDTEFTCANGRCIPKEQICDQTDDCRDGAVSDELNCPNRTCQPGYHSCLSTSICIPRRYLCDGDNDCGDGSDENPTFCLGEPCDNGDFRCENSGRCLPAYWHCDGDNDCGDNSDEPPFCGHTNFTCFGSQFTCDNGRCVPDAWICDSDNDCGDGSDEDERHSCLERSCSPNYFTCTKALPGRRKCIPISWKCDGEADCDEAEDEMHCVQRTCEEGEFTCNNGLCVKQDYYCDHDNDCGDNSDEPRTCEYPTCDDNVEYTCHNARCIPKHWMCDGDNDCRDTSDESDELCVTVQPTCSPGEFQCEDNTCILYSLVCNKHPECSDLSDERHCGVDECADTISNQCEHDCVNTATSYYCQCRSGYTLMPDRKACRDIDECTENPGVCSQVCENTRGSYICKCVEGYQKEPDGRTCKAVSDAMPYLIFSNRYYLRKLALDLTRYDLITDGFSNVVALDFDIKEDRLYFTDVPNHIIQRVFLNGTGLETIVRHYVPDGEGIAIDWVGRKIYWADRTNDMIEVAELDGSSRKTLVSSGLSEPRALAAYPQKGYIFWTDWSLSYGHIGRIGMDGSNRSIVVQDDKMGWPNGLTIDYTTDRIYWADAHFDYIAFVDLDGGNRHEVTTTDIAHPFAITVFENYIYWTDWNTKSIYKADKFTGEDRRVLQTTIHRPMDIHVYHPLRQRDMANPCGSNNGGCSHLCLISPGGATFSCACPDDFVLRGDQKTCISNCSSTQFRCADDNKCIPLLWKCDGEDDCRDGSDEPSSCSRRVCAPGLFQCDNFNCTRPQWICDNDNDCGDNSDEVNCELRHCGRTQFRCANDRCVSKSYLCDGDNDCGDNSDEDEDFCSTRTCSPGMFTCDNGYCIPEAWYCDWDNDCGDESDEQADVCKLRPCQETWFSCKTNYRCVPEWAVCDGNNDCRDNSDEDPSVCRSRECNDGEFRCVNHHCIPNRWQCDGDDDCGDGSDEIDCTNRPCSESEFTCHNDACIPSRWLCDHDNDCGDGSDELECHTLTCPADKFQCTSGHCIPESYRCDGDKDCREDASDEIDCPTRYPDGRYCPANKFQCDNTVCILMSWRCDGDDDCVDGSDETASVCENIDCPEDSRFRCNNNKCVPRYRLCDGVDNCGDASDENTHDICQEIRECTVDEFKCANKQCVSISDVCDTFDDCGDATDELGCHKSDETINECATNNGGCERECHDIADGYLCSCGIGYRPSPSDKRVCEDVDECVDPVCMQLCDNLKGSFTCKCARGYIDEIGDGSHCRPLGEAKSLLYTDGSELRRYFENTDTYGDLVIGERRTWALDYFKDELNQTVAYWTDTSQRTIKRSYVSDNIDQLAFSQNLEILDLIRPEGIAVDWVSRLLYWTDSGDEVVKPRIEVSMLDGRYRKTLLTNLGKPGAIAVNPRRGWMYWVDSGAHPKIEAAWMNGNNKTTLVADRIVEPTGITIDFANSDRIYWCDRKENIIETMNFDGSNRKVLKAGDALNHPFNLEVFEGHLYWTNDTSILQFDKLGRGIPTTLIGDLTLPVSLKALQYMRYPQERPRCKAGLCSHLCLLIPNSYRCACPNGDEFIAGSLKLCKGAKEEPRDDPVQCPCLNGGICERTVNDTIICRCPRGWLGSTCSVQARKSNNVESKRDITVMIAVFTVLLIILIAIVIAVLIYYRRKHRAKYSTDQSVSFRSGMNVDLGTPSYLSDEGDVTTNGEPVLQGEFQIDTMNSTAFSNPIYDVSLHTSEEPSLASPVSIISEKTGLPNSESASAPEEITVDMPLPASEKMPPPTEPLPKVKEQALPPNGPPAYNPTEDNEEDTTQLVEKDTHEEQ